MTKRNRLKQDNTATGKKRPMLAGTTGTRLLWDSYYRGTYVKAKHGPLV